MFEEKEVKDTEKTIHYYRFNHFMQNGMITFELIYCLLCMSIFLLVIYWNHEDMPKVILGQDDGFMSDDGDDDITYEEKLNRMHFLQERERQGLMLDKHMSNYNSSFSSGAGAIEDQRANKSQTYLSSYQVDSLKSKQRVMKIDSVYNGPTQSAFVKSVNGSIQRDKRMKMNYTMQDVNSKLDRFQNLKSGRRKTPGMNTSRSKVSNSTARLNMREFKPTP